MPRLLMTVLMVVAAMAILTVDAAISGGASTTTSSSSSSNETFSLVKLSLSEYPMARCIDGSPGAYYFLPAPADSKHPSTWEFFFQGGGWCVNNTNCLERSKTNLGSSKHYPETMDAVKDGPLDRDAANNPSFADANVVFLKYCDGYSFMGSRDAPIEFNGSSLYLRGSFIRKAILEHVMNTQPTFRSATEVLISGCSAGGLAAYLHTTTMTQWFRTVLPHVVKIKTAPLSGFFLNAENVMGQLSWGSQMRAWFPVANASVDADPSCLAALPPSLHDMCIFAEVVYARQKTPTFVFNSQLDLWQAACILLGGETGGENFAMPHCVAYPKYKKCALSILHSRGDFNCTDSEFEPLYTYQFVFRDRIASVATFTNNGNGMFVPSCITHCENYSSDWTTVVVNGTTASQAFTSWWQADDDAKTPASTHSFIDCTDSQHWPFTCNPTCRKERN